MWASSVSQIVHKAFPNAESKIAGKSRTKHIHVAGIAPVLTVTMEGISTSKANNEVPIGSHSVLLETEHATNKQLTERLLQELE